MTTILSETIATELTPVQIRLRGGDPIGGMAPRCKGGGHRHNDIAIALLGLKQYNTLGTPDGSLQPLLYSLEHWSGQGLILICHQASWQQQRRALQIVVYAVASFRRC